MRMGFQHGAAIATTSTSALLKSLTDRSRPDGSNTESFPSSHSSRAFSYAASARRNIQASGLPGPARTSLGIGVTVLAAGTAWGRVEGGVHYPSDVLAGAALGNFMALFINDTFLETRHDMQVHIEVTPELKQVSVSWSF
jgi:membrane-associated phospholipid phosphatase